MIATLTGGARPVPPGDLPAGYWSGWSYRTAFIDMTRYLPYLQARLERAGAVIVRECVERLDDLGPIVVNATGLGAREVARDVGVVPVRGQLLVLDAPGSGEFFDDTDDEGVPMTYIYPHATTVVLGGTSERGSENLRHDEQTAQQILARAVRIRPALAQARVLGHRVGLRPTRASVRLEAEPTTSGGIVVHCYGHGGGGASLAHGSARTVAALLTRLCDWAR